MYEKYSSDNYIKSLYRGVKSAFVCGLSAAVLSSSISPKLVYGASKKHEIKVPIESIVDTLKAQPDSVRRISSFVIEKWGIFGTPLKDGRRVEVRGLSKGDSVLSAQTYFDKFDGKGYGKTTTQVDLLIRQLIKHDTLYVKKKIPVTKTIPILEKRVVRDTVYVPKVVHTPAIRETIIVGLEERVSAPIDTTRIPLHKPEAPKIHRNYTALYCIGGGIVAGLITAFVVNLVKEKKKEIGLRGGQRDYTGVK